jgi:serine/threonine-protein kinase
VLRLPYAAGAWRPSEVVSGLDVVGRPEPVEADGRLYVYAPAQGGGLARATEAGRGWTVADVNVPAYSASGAAAAAVGSEVAVWVRTNTGTLSCATAG